MNTNNLTKKEREMILALRATEASESKQDDKYRNIKADLNSSIENALVAGLASSNPEVKEMAESYSQMLQNKMVEQGVSNVGSLSLSDSEYNHLIGVVHSGVGLDAEVSKEYEVIQQQAILYDTGMTDEQYTEAVALDLERSTPTSTDNPDEKVYIRNEATGTIFEKRADGSLSPKLDAEAEYEQASASSDESFMQSGGTESQDFLSSLETK